jgi:hypothetical protein
MPECMYLLKFTQKKLAKWVFSLPFNAQRRTELIIVANKEVALSGLGRKWHENRR